MPEPTSGAEPRPAFRRRRIAVVLSALALLLFPAVPRAAPQGQMNIAVHVSLAPLWFDPADTVGTITPFLLLYAIHDAVLKPLPEGNPAPALAERYTVSEDTLVYDFTLRDGIRFHNNEPVTADDVKFSFERYRGNYRTALKERVASFDVLDQRRFRITLKEPWPDFLTFYATSSGAAWVVPRAYVEKVGDEGFRKAPIGAGPYRFVSFTPGIELVMEAFEPYWRKTPSIKRLVFKVIPDESTRLVALKRGEVDLAYSIRGELGAEVQRSPGLNLKVAPDGATYWMFFPEQWDPKSPWHDPKVRLAAKYALDYEAINDALNLGYSRINGSFVPVHLDFYWQPQLPAYDPAKARQLLAEAGYPNGFDAGFYTCDASYANLGEAAVNNLNAVGIRVKLRPLERAAFDRGFLDKRYKGIVQSASAAFGNAATRLEAFVVQGGAYVHGSYPDIDALHPLQARETDIAKRTEILHRMQQMVHERTMFVPIWQLGFLNAAGPRVGESGFALIKGFVYTAPYEDMTLKDK